MEELKGWISDFYVKECCKFIKRVREYRHKTVLERHLKKFEQLCNKTNGGHSNTKSGCSNKQQEHICKVVQTVALTPKTTTTTSNTETATTTPPVAALTPEATTITTTMTVHLEKWVRNPLTKGQVPLLAHGPNFAIAPRHPLQGLHHCCEGSLLEPGAT